MDAVSSWTSSDGTQYAVCPICGEPTTKPYNFPNVVIHSICGDGPRPVKKPWWKFWSRRG